MFLFHLIHYYYCFTDLRTISLALAFDSHAQNFVARTYFDIIHYHGSFINLCSKLMKCCNGFKVLEYCNSLFTLSVSLLSSISFSQNYFEHTMLWIVLFFLLD